MDLMEIHRSIALLHMIPRKGESKNKFIVQLRPRRYNKEIGGTNAQTKMSAQSQVTRTSQNGAKLTKNSLKEEERGDKLTDQQKTQQ